MSNESVCNACASPTENVLCNDCLRVFRSNLEIAEWLTEQLSITMSRQSATGRKDGGKSAETPDPVHWGAAFALNTLTLDLRAAANAMAEDLHLVVQDAPAVFLLENFDQLRIWVHAAFYFTAIDRATARAMKAIDCEPPKSEYRAPCDVEGCTGEWWTIPGDTYVSCNACGVAVSQAKVKERLTGMLDGNLYSISDMALVMTIKWDREVKRDRIHALTKREGDPLKPRGRTAEGVYLYSVMDVEARLSRSRG